VRFPALDDQLPDGKTWIRGDASKAASGFDLDELEQFTASDPRDVLSTLRAVTGDVETVGSEELQGVPTTHYHATMDPAELGKLATGTERTATESLVDQLGMQSSLGPVPVDVWLDAAGLVRKLSMSYEATEPCTSQSSEVSMSFELWDYGEVFDIALPPALQVADTSALRD
jgi:hypothetical protein